MTVELPLLHLLRRHASLHNAAPFTPPASPPRTRPSKSRRRWPAGFKDSGRGRFKRLTWEGISAVVDLDCKGFNEVGRMEGGSTAKHVQNYARVADPTQSIPDKRSTQAAET